MEEVRILDAVRRGVNPAAMRKRILRAVEAR
jgi:hypothetical protein